jgi:hypothetical protein
MTTPRLHRSARYRAAAILAAAALATGLLAGCGDGADTDCSLRECTITFDRDEQGSANVLGISVDLVSVTDNTATVAVAGRETTIPVDGVHEVGGFEVSVRSITADAVVVVVSR